MAWIAGCCLALITPRAIEVEWDRSSSPEVIGYRIYCAKEDQPPERLSAGNTTTFKLDGLEPGATYKLYATAYDATGRESPPSNTLTYTVPPESDPYAVAITSFTRAKSGSVRVNWDSVPGTAYRVLFKDSLAEPVWRVMETELLAGSESMYFVDLSAAQAPERFYRIQFISDTPTLATPIATPNDVELRWSSRQGRTYRVLATSSLTQPTWQIIADNLPASIETLGWTDPAPPTAAMRFYRVELTD